MLGNNIALVVYEYLWVSVFYIFFTDTILSGEDPSLIVVFYQTLLSTGIILLTAEFLPKVFFNYILILQLKYLLSSRFFFYLFYPITYLIIQFTDIILSRFLKQILIKFNFHF